MGAIQGAKKQSNGKGETGEAFIDKTIKPNDLYSRIISVEHASISNETTRKMKKKKTTDEIPHPRKSGSNQVNCQRVESKAPTRQGETGRRLLVIKKRPRSRPADLHKTRTRAQIRLDQIDDDQTIQSFHTTTTSNRYSEQEHPRYSVVHMNEKKKQNKGGFLPQS